MGAIKELSPVTTNKRPDGSPSISRKVVPEFPAFNTSALLQAAQSNTFNLHSFCIQFGNFCTHSSETTGSAGEGLRLEAVLDLIHLGRSRPTKLGGR